MAEQLVKGRAAARHAQPLTRCEDHAEWREGGAQKERPRYRQRSGVVAERLQQRVLIRDGDVEVEGNVHVQRCDG